MAKSDAIRQADRKARMLEKGYVKLDSYAPAELKQLIKSYLSDNSAESKRQLITYILKSEI